MADDHSSSLDLEELAARPVDVVHPSSLDHAVELLTRAADRRGRKPKPRPSRAAVRAYRRRQRMGLVVLRCTVPEGEIAQFLISSGRLTATETFDRRRVEEECSRALIELALRWQPKDL
jgi:hypothetical protein